MECGNIDNEIDQITDDVNFEHVGVANQSAEGVNLSAAVFEDQASEDVNIGNASIADSTTEDINFSAAAVGDEVSEVIYIDNADIADLIVEDLNFDAAAIEVQVSEHINIDNAAIGDSAAEDINFGAEVIEDQNPGEVDFDNEDIADSTVEDINVTGAAIGAQLSEHRIQGCSRFLNRSYSLRPSGSSLPETQSSFVRNTARRGRAFDVFLAMANAENAGNNAAAETATRGGIPRQTARRGGILPFHLPLARRPQNLRQNIFRIFSESRSNVQTSLENSQNDRVNQNISASKEIISDDVPSTSQKSATISKEDVELVNDLKTKFNMHLSKTNNLLPNLIIDCEMDELPFDKLVQILPRLNAESPLNIFCKGCDKTFLNGTEYIRLKCAHTYHEDCLLVHLKDKRQCPKCKHDLKDWLSMRSEDHGNVTLLKNMMDMKEAYKQLMCVFRRINSNTQKHSSD